MRLTNVAAIDRWIFVVLRVRQDGRTGTVPDRIDTLAEWAGVSGRRVQQALSALTQHGLLRRQRHASPGGERGHAWDWTTTPLPYDSWPIEPIAHLIVSIACFISVFYREEGARNAPSKGKNAQEPAQEDAEAAIRARTTTSDNPASSSRHLSREAGHSEGSGRGNSRRCECGEHAFEHAMADRSQRRLGACARSGCHCLAFRDTGSA